MLLLAAYFMSKRITLPIKLLNSAINDVVTEYGGHMVSFADSDEIGSITEGFNILTSKLKEFVGKTIADERIKSEFEIRALQYQMNPHFLYNVLSSIRLTAMMNSDEQTADALMVLAGLLRRTVGKAGNVTTVADEMENIRDMVFIFEFRHDSKINFNNNIEPEILDCLIPNLFLQPIVENAIVHGIDIKSKDASVDINGFNDNGDIVFEIVDNGCGMSQDEIEKVMKNRDVRMGYFTKVGIKNVNDRIRLIYGAKYGLELSSEIGKGTKVIVRIPAVKEEQDDEKDPNN